MDTRYKFKDLPIVKESDTRVKHDTSNLGDKAPALWRIVRHINEILP